MPTPIEYADSPTQDWNVYLGLTPDPRVPRVPIPQVDPWGGMNVAGMELPLDEAMKVTHMAATLRAQQEEARAAAIRYQGTMEFQYLLGKGVDSGEAIRQTAGKMFYGHPASVSAVMRQAQKAVAPTSINAVPIYDEEGNIVSRGVVQPSGAVHVLPATAPAGDMEIEKQEVFPGSGVWMVRPRGSTRWTISSEKPASKQMTANQRVALKAKAADLTLKLSSSGFTPESEDYKFLKNTIDEIKAISAEPVSPVPEEPWDKYAPWDWNRTIVQPPTEAPSPPMEEPNPYPDTLPSFSVPAPAEPAPMGMGLNVRDGMSVPTPMTNAVPVPPLPAAVAPTPPTVAPTQGVRIDPVLGRMTPELDRFYAMTPAEQRMYALTNKSFGAPKPAVAPATTVVQTNLVRPPETLAPPPPKVLTAEIAREFLKMANGDKDKARKLAKEAGYSF